MTWYRSRFTYIYGLVGLAMGTLILLAGAILQLKLHSLPFSFESYIQLHQMDVMVILFDLFPFVLGVMAALLGWLRHLTSLITGAKRECANN